MTCEGCKFKKSKLDIIWNGTTGTVDYCIKGHELKRCSEYKPNLREKLKPKPKQS